MDRRYTKKETSKKEEFLVLPEATEAFRSLVKLHFTELCSRCPAVNTLSQLSIAFQSCRNHFEAVVFSELLSFFNSGYSLFTSVVFSQMLLPFTAANFASFHSRNEKRLRWPPLVNKVLKA